MNLQQRNMITSEEIYEDLCSKIENLDYMPGVQMKINLQGNVASEAVVEMEESSRNYAFRGNAHQS